MPSSSTSSLLEVRTELAEYVSYPRRRIHGGGLDVANGLMMPEKPCGVVDGSASLGIDDSKQTIHVLAVFDPALAP